MTASGRVEAEPGTFPPDLRPCGRLVVVVGGGGAAGRLVGLLLTAGARVLVIAQELSAGLADLAARGLICAQRERQAADLDGAWLVLTCADQDPAQASAAAGAQRPRIGAAGGRDSAAARVPVPAELAGQAPRPDRRVLVLGGARSGKSAAAESMLADAGVVDYVATGELAGAGDAEWDRRVREHRARRPARWRTLETCDVAAALADQDAVGPVLVDCLATWLARVMEDCGLWSGGQDADARLRERTDRLVAAWQQTQRHAVAVSNEVGCGVVPATVSGRRFRDELGRLNSQIAASSQEVWLCTAGIPCRLR